MRIIAISDTHGKHRNLILPKGDVFIFAGDISHFNNKSHFIDFNDWMGTLPYRYKLVIAGNHDEFFEEHPERIPELTSNYIYLQDKEIIIDGIKFYGSPYVPHLNYMAFYLPREKAKEKWNKIPDDTDVLITHCPPYQILDNVYNDNFGEEELLNKVFEIKPKLHIFGHIHNKGNSFKKIGKILFYNVSIKNNKVCIIDIVNGKINPIRNIRSNLKP